MHSKCVLNRMHGGHINTCMMEELLISNISGEDGHPKKCFKSLKLKKKPHGNIKVGMLDNKENLVGFLSKDV